MQHPPTKVVAHRGSSGEHPEHTLGAYEAAIAEGADALECDVRLTRDGVLVCVHDRRVNRTSNGRGVVSTLELAELTQLDFASWKSGLRDGFGDVAGPDSDELPDTDRGRVLTLERLLQLVEGTGVELHVETKHPTRYGGLVERALLDLLGRYGLTRPASHAESPVTVMSFSGLSLRRIHSGAPALPTVLLMDRVPPWYRDGSLPTQVPAAGPSLAVVRAHPSYVERVQRHGHRVHVWTCDEPADIDLVVTLGVDAVISNHPVRALRRLGRA